MIGLGRTFLAKGERRLAVRWFTEAAGLARTRLFVLAAALAGIEEACDEPAEFREIHGGVRAGDAAKEAPALAAWFLEPAEVCREPWHAVPPLQEGFSGALATEWTWHDPLQDCSFTVGDGLTLRAANGRRPRERSVSAPRLLRRTNVVCTVQVRSRPASRDHPPIGGLLLWHGAESYLYLDRGIWGPADIWFPGSIAGTGCVIGRGRLIAEQICLRLECSGGRVRALCSAGDRSWFSLGETAFPPGDSVEVGLCALGHVERTFYPAAHSDGTAIRFDHFQLWAKD
jgi:hypothetical protein